MQKIFKTLALMLLVTSGTAFAASKGEVLVLLSGKTELPLQNNKTFPSGYYLNEFGVPADALIRAGYHLTVVTPEGTQPRADKRSRDALYFGGDVNEMHRIGGVVSALTQAAQVKSLKTVLAAGLDNYDALFIPGGHAPLIDLSNNPEVGRLLRDFHRKGKPTAAICHGPITLLAAQDDPQGYEQGLVADRDVSADHWIYRGYKMTIFADEEEKIFEASLKGEKLRYYPARAMRQAGGNMNFAAAWQPHVVVDRELITGQNPFSDHLLASALLKALAAR